MISPLAVALAMAFWAPYAPPDAQGHRHLPCMTQDVHVYDTAPMALHLDPDAVAYARIADDQGNPLPSHCAINVSRAVADAPVVYQCWVIAHEWGHSFFLLPHSSDPRNIMFATDEGSGPPAACEPPKTRRSVVSARFKIHPDSAPPGHKDSSS